jgi:hypothetical protein
LIKLSSAIYCVTVNSADVNRVSCQVTDKVREVTRKVETDFVIV